MNRQLINGDCLEELKKLDDNSVDLLCTAPPYGYGFMGKHWDTFKAKDETKSQQVGWMSPGMKKDTYGMKEFFDPIWTECLRVLKPGALAFVMSAPRSDVQTIMAQTLRDAGFDISFTPIYWTYASGFPKAMNMGKMLDKKYGNKREEVEEENWGRKNRSKEYSANVFTGDRINDDRATGSGADHLLNSDRKASWRFLFSRWHSLWYLNGIHLRYNYLCAAGAFPYWQPLSAAIYSWFFVLSESVSATPTGTAGLCRTLYKCRYGGLYIDLGSAGSAICPDKMAYITPFLNRSPTNLSSGR